MVHPEPPFAGDETAALLGSLERQRAILAWKCDGLDAQALSKKIPPSEISLGGLLKHLALVEDHQLFFKLLGDWPRPPWDEVDWDADPDWEWHSAANDSPEELFALWGAAVERSRAVIERALANGGLDTLGHVKSPEGESPNLRRLLLDLIEEYARHVGHADLIRESIDGVTGEDPPPEWRSPL